MRARSFFTVIVAIGFAATALLFQFGLVEPGDVLPAIDLTPRQERTETTEENPTALAPAAKGTLRIHYVDVGQGDAVVWELPDGSLVIYDCGPAAPTAEANPLVAFLRDELNRPVGSPIAALIASHGHLDHIGGCDEVFETFEVAHVYDAWYEGDDRPKSYQRFQDAVRAEGSALHVLTNETLPPDARAFAAGDVVELPASVEDMGAFATILWPAQRATDWDRIAAHGIVIRLSFGATTACFQGDIEEREEATLANGRGDRSCTVYLMGHHGSRHASTTAWLTRMLPEIAVVSYGADNAYGHPTNDAVCRVTDAGTPIYGTGGAGTVTVELDGLTARVLRGAPLSGACA